MSTSTVSRGDYWFSLLTEQATLCPSVCASVKAADGEINGKTARFIAVVPDHNSLYPRARQGEVGLLEGWSLAKVVRDVIALDKDKPHKRAIVAIIDVPSQAYGRREEAFAIHQALAGAASAYADARLAGHPVIGLIVGKAMSGAFLAHGYQANRLIAFNDPQVMIHAMGKEAAARITLRSVEALEKLAATIPPMAYDIENYSKLGLLYKLLTMSNAMQPMANEIELVKATIVDAINDALQDGVSLHSRLQAKDRHASLLVREKMRAQW
ncbi:malonate decarboxylase gamma subunit [Orbus hercynius]|uniref:Malonate decarboxylase gamma subunit n=1 Tax=Orbus hercynius TaxID=593135 RepID=A0A495RAI5_9GAMM|nr:biotin-independent malonate decarboxylase subunit gamma [Orbus hercynius]RKS84462.1 malonate decarboxylase gamma subunit [Orbus hercynius]